jgi:NAD(P)-dependent dehydrogenase (short-subunit alcohol dehydrogenase family)
MKQPSVVVTGASSGIGEACVLDLDQRGFQVFATVRRTADAARLAGQTSDRLHVLHLDVTDPASVHAAVAEVAGVVGEAGLQGLVNNAGIAVGGPIEAVPPDVLRQQLEVNVVGTVAVTQAFLPLLRQGGGRIVNMGSVGGINAFPFVGPYCASKFALEAITDVLRMELAPWGLHVSIIEPASIRTPIWEKSTAQAAALLNPQVLPLYEQMLHAMAQITRHQAAQGASPDLVAAAVHHALTAHYPKTRYLVAPTARLRKFLQYLPDRLRDRILLRRLARAAPP